MRHTGEQQHKRALAVEPSGCALCATPATYPVTVPVKGSHQCQQQLHPCCTHEICSIEERVLLQGHEGSVEDIQWAPAEACVFASAGCDGTVRVWDTRHRSGPMLTVKVQASQQLEQSSGDLARFTGSTFKLVICDEHICSICRHTTGHLSPMCLLLTPACRVHHPSGRC